MISLLSLKALLVRDSWLTVSTCSVCIYGAWMMIQPYHNLACRDAAGWSNRSVESSSAERVKDSLQTATIAIVFGWKPKGKDHRVIVQTWQTTPATVWDITVSQGCRQQVRIRFNWIVLYFCFVILNVFLRAKLILGKCVRVAELPDEVFSKLMLLFSLTSTWMNGDDDNSFSQIMWCLFPHKIIINSLSYLYTQWWYVVSRPVTLIYACLLKGYHFRQYN